jgi:DNA modification methylase
MTHHRRNQPANRPDATEPTPFLNFPEAVIEYVPIDDLTENSDSPRTHSAKQQLQLSNAVREFGILLPIVIDECAKVMAGNARLAVAKYLGLKTVPTIQYSHLTEQQKVAFTIADNRIAENATWDYEVLAPQLEMLSKSSIDIDPTIVGIDMPEIDLIILADLAVNDEGDADDDMPAIDRNGFIVTKPGDLWILGDHRLLCADALLETSYQHLMMGEHAQMIISDVPYNVRIQGHVSGKGRNQHPDFLQASGELSSPEFENFLAKAFRCFVRYSVDGSIHFVFIDWRHLSEILNAGSIHYTELKNLIVWAKSNAGMGSFYRSQHELILAYKNGSTPHINYFELGQHGRHRSNVWTYAGANAFGKDRDDDLARHPTSKPVAMIVDALLDCSDRGGIVLDPFVGGGTTIIAAERTGRQAYAMDLDPLYVDATIHRWQALTGQQAIHESSGTNFAEIEDERREQTGRSSEDQSSVACQKMEN